jgi:hypothetical protein
VAGLRSGFSATLMPMVPSSVSIGSIEAEQGGV